MEIHLQGSVTIKAKPSRVFELLTDPSFIAGTLPDAQDVRIVDLNNVEAKLRVKLSLVSSTLKVKLRIGERKAPLHATIYAEGTGGGSALKLNSTFDLEGNGITHMRWAADAQVSGLMAGLGSTLLHDFAKKKVGEIFEGITKAIEAQA